MNNSRLQRIKVPSGRQNLDLSFNHDLKLRIFNQNKDKNVFGTNK